MKYFEKFVTKASRSILGFVPQEYKFCVTDMAGFIVYGTTGWISLIS